MAIVTKQIIYFKIDMEFCTQNSSNVFQNFCLFYQQYAQEHRGNTERKWWDHKNKYRAYLYYPFYSTADISV